MKQILGIFLSLGIVCILTGCEMSSETVNTLQEGETQGDFSAVYESNNSVYNTRNIVPLKIDYATTTPQNNKAAYITSQCYTKTMDNNGSSYNPCFACHINSKEPNYVDDWELQETAVFNEYTKTNRFTNLFKDRSSLVSQISDEEIVSYVHENNYMQKGQILLANRLNALPKQWDFNHDGKWGGYTPDCYFDFDNEGFDRMPDGNYTLWRAFGYYPFLGTFWPTNGSTDDVLIRLPKVFAQNENGDFDIEIYKLNLSIIESLIKEKDIVIIGIDEKKYGIDLNQNGILDVADKIVFRWIKPRYDSSSGKLSDFSMRYVGYAKKLLESNEYLIAPGLYPKNTEFLHSVRYIDIDSNRDRIKMANRMKELRYAKKISWVPYSKLSNVALTEIKEKDISSEKLRTVIGNTEQGALNNTGWRYQGFIEDAKGELRPQNYEETLYCIGCHSGIGAIADSTFVFQRKFENNTFHEGWYHWSQDSKGLKDIPEPMTKDGRDEYTLYLEANQAGDEFRDNAEVIKKFFDTKGEIKEEEVADMHEDISTLLYPSTQRAIMLNKAYKIIVEEQSYIYGRDAHIKPVENVHKEMIPGSSTGIEAIAL